MKSPYSLTEVGVNIRGVSCTGGCLSKEAAAIPTTVLILLMGPIDWPAV